MPAHHILVVGTGAIGSFFASRFASVQGTQVSTICRSNYEAVKSKGIRVTSPLFGDSTFKPAYTFANPDDARSSKQRHGLRWDYLFVSTKVILEQGDPSTLLEGLVDEDSSIILSQNGLGIEEPYWKRFPRNPIISTTTRTSTQQLDPNHTKHNFWTRTTIGPYTPKATPEVEERGTKRTAEFANLLNAAGIPDVDVLDHAGMQFARWHKVAINAAMNPTAVLAGGPTNQAMALDDDLYAHMTSVMHEILDAAQKIIGQPIPETLPKVAAVMDGVKEDESGSQPSMWADWKAGRRVELEAILGNPLQQAREAGIELPRTQSLYALLKMAQRMRDEK